MTEKKKIAHFQFSIDTTMFNKLKSLNTLFSETVFITDR